MSAENSGGLDVTSGEVKGMGLAMTNPSTALQASLNNNPADPGGEQDNEDVGGNEEARGMGGALAMASAAIGGAAAIASMFMV